MSSKPTGWSRGCVRGTSEHEVAERAKLIAEIRHGHGLDEICGDDYESEHRLRKQRTGGHAVDDSRIGPLYERSVS